MKCSSAGTETLLKRRSGRAAASAGTRITAVSPVTGPESIEGYYDEALAAMERLIAAQGAQPAAAQFGSHVHEVLAVHDGKVVQLDVTERHRF